VGYAIRFEAARGKDATSGFRSFPLTGVPSPTDSKRIVAFQWDPAGLSGGPYTLRVRLVNPDTDELMALGTRNITLDDTDHSPDVQLAAPATASGQVDVTVTVTDADLEGWRLETVDAAGVRKPVLEGRTAGVAHAGWDTALLLDGTYLLQVTAWDKLGNEKVVNRTVPVHNPAPAVTLSALTADPGSAFLSFTYTAAATVSIGLSVRLNDREVAKGAARGPAGTDVPASVPVDLTGLNPGVYAVAVQVEDAAGRKGTGEFSLKMVTPLPGPVLEELPEYTQGLVTLRFAMPSYVGITRFDIVRTGPDGVRTITMPTVPASPGPVEVTDRPDAPGRHVYKVVALWDDGRQSDSVGRATIVDAEGPRLGNVSVSGIDGLGINMRWEPAVDTSGVKSYSVVLLDGGRRRVLSEIARPGASGYATALPEGEHTVLLAATDRASNVSESAPLTFRVQPGAVALMSKGRFLPGDVPGFIEDGRTWVPLRLFGETLGYQVSWDGKRQTASILDSRTGKVVLAAVGDTTLRILDRTGEQLVVLPAAPRITGDRVVVPLRALVEALGARVEWNSDLRTVTILTD
jgi:hypothetical protein